MGDRLTRAAMVGLLCSAQLASAGCAGEPDYAGKLCSPVDPCPGVFVCSAKGTCLAPGDGQLFTPFDGGVRSPGDDRDGGSGAPLNPGRDAGVLVPGVDGGSPTQLDAGPPSGPVQVASSLDDYSGTQGLKGWYYGYIEPASGFDLHLMPAFDGTSWHADVGAYWTALTPVGGHPNGKITTGGKLSVEHWAVRRWVSTVDGPIRIKGHLAKAEPSASSNGIVGGIYRDGNEVWSKFIPGTDGVGVQYIAETTVQRGTLIELVIFPYDSDDTADATIFTAVIEH